MAEPVDFRKNYLLENFLHSYMKIVGMVPVYNEADIIKESLTHLINQGIDPVVLDSGSTDGTYEICQRFLEKGEIKLEQYVSNKFELATTLRKLYDMALLESPDWVIHSDADEFLESYDNNMDLKNAILQVDSEGYNLIQFNVFNFFMTKNDPISENSIKKRMLYYSFHFDFVFRAWKIYPGILPEPKGGHMPVFPSDLKYKVWPKKFVLRHYQFRDKIQALKKINERIKTFSETHELKAGWHVHYNEIKKFSFSDPVDHSILQKYEGDNNWNFEYKFSFNPSSKTKIVIPEDGVIKPSPTYHELYVLVNRLRKEIQESNNESHQKLLEVFRKYSNNNFIFVIPGGNYGDQLIWKGAEKLAEQANIRYKSYTHADFMKRNIEPNEIVYVHGSGGFNRFWSGTPILELTKAIQEHVGPTILGPATFLDDENYIKEVIKKIFHNRLSKDVYFFVREKKSYALLKGLLPSDVHLSVVPDTAFAIVKKDLVAPDSYEGKGYTLYAIRQDKESVKQYQRPNPFAFWLDPVDYAKDFKSWVQIHNNANTVFTDRAHSAIVSTLLGKKVYFLPNIYHKNRSMWEYSLKDFGVHWLEELKPYPRFKAIQKSRLYDHFVNSHMYNNFLRKYHTRNFTLK